MRVWEETELSSAPQISVPHDGGGEVEACRGELIALAERSYGCSVIPQRDSKVRRGG